VKRILIAIATFACAPAALADVSPLAGSRLIESCRAFSASQTAEYGQGVCMGIIAAVWRQNAGRLICSADGVTNGQMVRVVVKYMDDHPAELHLRLDDLALSGMARAFPCKKP
jgi:hypothetical protein